MKVIDVLTESKKTNEGPIRFLKRTLGKDSAMGKDAQLDVELDREVNNLYKDFYAVSKQDPKLKGMTAKGLGQFMVSKGFANKPSEVMRFINQDPSMSRILAKGWSARAWAKPLTPQRKHFHLRSRILLQMDKWNFHCQIQYTVKQYWNQY